MNELIRDFQHEFRRHRRMAERAMRELDDEAFFARPGKVVNPVALIVKHMAGNLGARWTDFLTEERDDSEESRDRDSEFVIGPEDSREHLMVLWNAGWGALEQAIGSLSESELKETITIRGEEHSVQQALLRGLGHAAYHTGQILYLVRLLKPDATWLTIAPGESKSHRAAYRKE